MPPEVHHSKFTYEDYLLFPNDGKRHELMDGEHYMTPAPNTKHQRISANLLEVLHAHARQARLGTVLAAPTDVVLSDLDVVQPDLLFVSTARAAIITESCIRGGPDLIVEILSESTRKVDETMKRKLYERHCVTEYWIVDPVLDLVKVYRLTAQGYVRAAELSREAADSLTTPLLSHLRIPLSDIFG